MIENDRNYVALAVAFDPVDARYVKLVTPDSADGTFASIAELDLFGDGSAKE